MRAGQIRIGGLAARAVDEIDRHDIALGGQVPVGPAHQGDDRRIEIERPLRQPVFVPVWVGAVAHPLEHAVTDELP
jgi:hypothetical protein